MSKKKRVLLACPAKGGMPDYWITFIMQLVMESLRGETKDFEIDFVVESGNHAINLSRNIIAQFAEEKCFDRLVMVDKDHPINMPQLMQLLSHDVPVVSALYCKKKPGMVSWIGVKTRDKEIQPDGLVECDLLGTGLINIDVNALRKVRQDNPDREFLYDDDNGVTHQAFEYFPMGVVGPRTPRARISRLRKQLLAGKQLSNDEILKIIDGADAVYKPGRLLGEDYFFSFLMRKSGFAIYMDTKLEILHEGNTTFPIFPDAVMKPAPVYTNSIDFEEC